MRLGAHVSIAGGVYLAPKNGWDIGCEVIQIFSRSPRGLRNTKPLTAEEAGKFREAMEDEGMEEAVIHANYLINLASPRKPMLKLSRAAMVEEMERAETLGIKHVIFHPGSHLGKGDDFALKTIANSLDFCLRTAKAASVVPLLENTAGQGSAVGWDLNHLRKVLELCEGRDRLGVCIDTCHLFAAGYDIRTPIGYSNVISLLDKVVGLKRVMAFHLNDSKQGVRSHVDRHEHIGKGKIGKPAFRLLVNDTRFSKLPGCLETPGDDDDFRRNLRILKSLRG